MCSNKSNDWLNKQIIIHAIMGGHAPYDQPEFVELGLMKFNGNQHDCYNYGWVEEGLQRLDFNRLYTLYNLMNPEHDNQL